MADFLDRTINEVEPEVAIGRSTFTGLSYGHKTTITAGDLCPVYFAEVLPGDTFSVDTAFLARMATPVFPVCDNSYLDMFYFYVPFRLVWEHAREFYGENRTEAWVPDVEYTVPQLKFGYYLHSTDIASLSSQNLMTGAVPGSVMNYFGIPSTLYPRENYLVGEVEKNLSFSVSDLPNRAYRLIWNEFFRSTPVENPVFVPLDDSDRNYHVAASLQYDYGGRPLKVNRFFDMFSGCLPAPQFGDSVSAGLLNTDIPVIGRTPWDLEELRTKLGTNVYSMQFATRSNDTDAWVQTSVGNNSNLYTSTGNASRMDVGYTPGSNTRQAAPTNLHGVFINYSIGTINQLRQAFAVQRYLELMARGGQRYREILKNFFGVTSPDATVQVPEYLGGSRTPINMDQVLQTSATDSVSPQGNTAGYSLTTNVDNSFTKSFTEPGMIIGLACVRVSHTYTQMTLPYWFRKRKFDYYWPQFANISEQPIYKKNIASSGIPEIDNQVFGYQEAWVDYRYHPNMISGAFSPLAYTTDEYTADVKIHEEQSSLAQAWTYSDFYNLHYETFRNSQDTVSLTPPSLSAEWMHEDSKNVGQTLAVQNEPQFIVDFQFNVKSTRPMPVRSIPGLIDHH